MMSTIILLWHVNFPLFSSLVIKTSKPYMLPPYVLAIQWNPSKTDTVGTKNFVRYKGVSFTEGLFKPMEIRSRQSQVSVLSWVSAIEGCPLRGVPLYNEITFAMIQNEIIKLAALGMQVFVTKHRYTIQGVHGLNLSLFQCCSVSSQCSITIIMTCFSCLASDFWNSIIL